MIFEHPEHLFEAGFGAHHAAVFGSTFSDQIHSGHTAGVWNHELLSRRAADDPLDPFHSASNLDVAPKLTTGAATSEEIVVTGIRQTSYSDDSWNWAGDSGGTAGSGSGSTGGSGGGYVSAGVSAAANTFASAHVHNNGTTAADEKEYEKAHDDVAKLYDWAQAHPNDSVDIGNGHTITGAQLSADLAAMTINIVDTGGGTSGANTFYSGSTGTTTVTINPNNSNVQAYNDPNNFSGTGADYVVFHEIGHSVYDVSYGGLPQGPTAEAQADTAANSLENALGIPIFTH